jgi:hypothetical protein
VIGQEDSVISYAFIKLHIRSYGVAAALAHGRGM